MSVIRFQKKTDGKAVTYLYRTKCMECGLHYIVCSWDEVKPLFYCPECGKQGKQLRWKETADEPIFTFVPGDAENCEPIGPGED